MAIRKKNYRKKPLYKRKKRFTRKLAIPNSVKADYSCILRAVDEPFITNDTLVDATWSKIFSLNNAQNYTNFTAIFDQYRINMVQITFRPVGATTTNIPYDDTSSGTAGRTTPNYAVSIDRDDSTLSTYSLIRSRQFSTIRGAGKSLTVKFRPNRLVNVFNGSASPDAYMVDNSKKFLDCANSTVPHFGIKMALEPFSEANVYKLQMEIKYFISFAQRRD